VTQYLTGGDTEATNVYIHGNTLVVLAQDQNSDFGTTGYHTLYVSGYGIRIGDTVQVEIWVDSMDTSTCDEIYATGVFKIDAMSGTVLIVSIQGLGQETEWIPFVSASTQFIGQFTESPDFTQAVNGRNDKITFS
jgi:hypothetical protein